MYTLIVVVALFAAAQASTGKPVACCEKARGYIADSESSCVFWQCVDEGHGYVGVRRQECPRGTRVPDDFHSPSLNVPCTEFIKYNYKTKSYASCDRAYPLDAPDYCDPHPHKDGVTCFDCNVELAGAGGYYAVGGTSACLLEKEGDKEKLDQWTCHSGQCFVRYETVGKYGHERKFLVRGCSDGISPLIKNDNDHNCQENTDNNKWYFCDGVKSQYPCNDGNPCNH